MVAETVDTAEPKRSSAAMVVAASSAGTIFEWYDFFVFGALSPIISKLFFDPSIGEATSFVFALLLFGVGFAIRPFGALVFGPMGDKIGRKKTFLITVTLMGAATFAIGLLPTFAQIGVWAPILLLVMRCLQGFALGGEWGGAAVYVTEHAPPHLRGWRTSLIASAAAIGLIGALGLILITRGIIGEQALGEWGWRIPFLVSLGLLAVSVWIRLGLNESPAFAKIKAEGTTSKAPLAESFLQWRNLKVVLIALFAIMVAQGVVWYTAHFYLQFYLERILKLPATTMNLLMIAAVATSAPLYVFFAWLSDRVGRKPIMLFGILLAVASFFPGYMALTNAANPALATAMASAPVVVRADPATCSVQFDPVGKTIYSSSCDIARSALSNAGVSYTTEPLDGGGLAQVHVGEAVLTSVSGASLDKAQLAAARTAFAGKLKEALTTAGYPAAADPEKANLPLVFAIMMLFITGATALYGPQAAALVELFPTRIRYTALSLPYHVGTGFFGGFQPAISFAIVVGTGNIFAGLWYPVILGGMSAVIMFFFLPETRHRDITL